MRIHTLRHRKASTQSPKARMNYERCPCAIWRRLSNDKKTYCGV